MKYMKNDYIETHKTDSNFKRMFLTTKPKHCQIFPYFLFYINAEGRFHYTHIHTLIYWQMILRYA